MSAMKGPLWWLPLREEALKVVAWGRTTDDFWRGDEAILDEVLYWLDRLPPRMTVGRLVKELWPEC